MNKDEIIAQAKLHMQESSDAREESVDRAVDDFRFLKGEHYSQAERAERESDGRPCITINSMPQFVRQVTGQIRSMNPAIKVTAADGSANPEIAELIEGLIRHIEYQSDASSVYEATAESAAACSFGHFRIRADYCDADSFEQELLIERIYNPFSVFTDPLAKHPTRKDARYRLIAEEVSKDDFAAQYPDAKLSDFTSEHQPADLTYWRAGDNVVVAEYYWIEDETFTLYQLGDGQVTRKKIEGMNVVRERKVRAPRVKWAKITGAEVLEGPLDIPGEFIPVVTITGEEWHLGEESYTSSVIRFAKDSAILYNVARSAQAEVMMLQPKAPYLITANQVRGVEDYWGEANKGSRPYLPYNHEDGALAPKREPPPLASSGLMQEMQLSAEDMKRTTGIYDASLGARSNETSGVAIDARKQESQNANSIYADNMVKAVAQAGRILVAMIPKIYDTERAVRILGQDDQEKIITINGLMEDQDGPVPINDLTIGKYDVRVSVGPSYSTKREASQDGMMEFLRVVPNAAAVTSDLVAKSQDWPDAERFAERLRKTLPPGIADDDEKDADPAQMQQAQDAQQAQMQEQQQAMQAQQQMQAMAMEEQQAKADKAKADADKARADASLAQLEVLEMEMRLGLVPAPMAQQGITAPPGAF